MYRKPFEPMEPASAPPKFDDLILYAHFKDLLASKPESLDGALAGLTKKRQQEVRAALQSILESGERMKREAERISRLLNNFYAHAPGGYRRLYQEIKDNPVDLTIRPSDFQPKEASMSARRYHESKEEFFRSIDAAIRACKLKIPEIEELSKEYAAAQDREDDDEDGVGSDLSTRSPEKIRTEINFRLFPAYLKLLLEDGYAHQDLIA